MLRVVGYLIVACGIAALVAIMLISHARANQYDVTWFLNHPRERASVVRACRNDARMDQRVCLNAGKAQDQADAMKRLQALEPQNPSSPIMREAIRRACLKQPAERGLLGEFCGRGM